MNEAEYNKIKVKVGDSKRRRFNNMGSLVYMLRISASQKNWLSLYTLDGFSIQKAVTSVHSQAVEIKNSEGNTVLLVQGDDVKHWYVVGNYIYFIYDEPKERSL